MNTHKQFLTELRIIMRDEYIAISKKKNPVSIHLDTATPEQLIYVLGQYSLFPKNIVSFLRTSQSIMGQYEWKHVQEELERNIGEEEGSQTEGIPHYDMLVKGISEELGADLGYAPITDLEMELRSLRPSLSMATFIQRVPEIVGIADPAYALGATYALESSAVPELVIVRNTLEQAINQLTGFPMARDGYLGKFFGAHLRIWEPGHEAGLRKTSEEYIQTPQERKTFEQGFREIMKTMDTMWIGLYQESQQLDH